MQFGNIVFTTSAGIMDQNPADCELALLSALKSCSSLSSGRQIHSLAFKLGFHSIQNTFINMYAKCGSIDDARQLFYMMPNKACVSYTTMIKALVRNHCFREALEVFKDMMSHGVLPNSLSLMNVISACSRFGEISNCRMIHALAIKLSVEESIMLLTNLMHAYCLCSSVLEARRLFDNMPDRNLATWNVMLNGYSKTGLVDMAKELFERISDKDVISWGIMIDGYTQLDCVREALIAYRAMLRTGLEPNEVMIVSLISTCGWQTAIDDGRQLHGTVVKKGFDCNDFLQTTIIPFYAACGMMDLASLQFDVGVKDHLESWNALIAGFIKNGMTDQARQVFEEMPERDVFSWSTMISGYAKTEQPKMTLEAFHKMVASGIKPNELTMVSVFSAIATLGTLKEGRWAHGYISSECIPLNDNLCAAMINMYAKCGSINSALQFFNQIRDKVSSVPPWNAILCGLASHGYASMCLEVFSDLQRYHIRPNRITLLGVLSACCHAGLVGPGRRIYKSMKSMYNVEPDIEHYGCMANLFGRAGLLEEAEEIIRSMR